MSPALLDALGWVPGRCRLAETRHGGRVRLSAEPDGSVRVDGQGRLVLPVGLWRFLGLRKGVAVLISTDTANGSLTLTPTEVLDRVVAS